MKVCLLSAMGLKWIQVIDGLKPSSSNLSRWILHRVVLDITTEKRRNYLDPNAGNEILMCHDDYLKCV